MASSDEIALETFSFTRRPISPLGTTTPPYEPDLSIAPPSPLFAGIDEVINTDPFPPFDDFALPSGAISPPPLHCAFHCTEKVCQHQRRRNQALPPCACVGDSFSSSVQLVSPTQPARPPPTRATLNHNRTFWQAFIRLKSPVREIEIHLNEAHMQIRDLAIETVAQALRNDAFMMAMRNAFPRREVQMTVETMDMFVETMYLYFNRTVQKDSPRTVSLELLWTELNVYLWTMLRDWVEVYGDEEEKDRVLVFAGPESLEMADSGTPAAVLALWQESMQVLVDNLVWRDQEVKTSYARVLMWVFIGCLLFLSVSW